MHTGRGLLTIRPLRAIHGNLGPGYFLATSWDTREVVIASGVDWAAPIIASAALHAAEGGSAARIDDKQTRVQLEPVSVVVPDWVGHGLAHLGRGHRARRQHRVDHPN